MRLFAFQIVTIALLVITVFGHTLNKRHDLIENVLKAVDEDGKSCPLNFLVQSSYYGTANLSDEEINTKTTEGLAKTCKSKKCIEAYIDFLNAYSYEIPEESESVTETIASLKQCTVGGNISSGASSLSLNYGLFITILSLIYYLI